MVVITRVDVLYWICIELDDFFKETIKRKKIKQKSVIASIKLTHHQI
jgi:hypothetical protein